MKRTFLLLFFLLPFIVNAQDCSHAHVHGCNFVWPNIYGDLGQEDDDFGDYDCLPTLSYNGMPDALHIINDVGNGLDFEEITITLTDIPPGSDFDLIVLGGCGETCTTLSDDPTGTIIGNGDESVTVTFASYTTLYIVVEGYMLDGGSTYTLQIGDSSCPYSVSYGCDSQPAVDCSTTNSFSGSLDYFPFWPTPAQQDAYWCFSNSQAEYGYVMHEDLYYISPSSFGNIQANLTSNGDARMFIYQCEIPLLDVFPYCITSGQNISVPIESGFGNVPSGYIIAVDATSPCDYTITFDYPGCEGPAFDPCGDCFPYVERPGNKCYIDMSSVPCQGGSFSYSSTSTGIFTNTSLDANNEITFPSSGEYLLCYSYDCEIDLPTNTESKAETGECCILVSIGQPCEEAPIAHFEIDPDIVPTGNGHQSFFDASSSTNTEWYNWDWGDGQNTVTADSNTEHNYNGENVYTTTCLTATNNCGMSRYCCSFYTYGESDFAWPDCNLPFDPYEPPQIEPYVSGNTLYIDDISSWACSAESVMFNPGDGTGSFPISCSGIDYNYPDDGHGYVACIIIDFGCFRICFYYTYRPPSFECEDAYELYCNEYGDNYITDANTDNWSNRVTNIVDYHDDCFGTNDGWDNTNVLEGNPVFARNEVIYQFTNPSDNHQGSITIDLIPLASNLDLDVFVYEDCFGSGEFHNCAYSSTHDNNPNGERDAVIIDNAQGGQTYYIVVDGQSNANTINEGQYELSVTCGYLCDKATIPIACGETYEGTTLESDNKASYYCNCPGGQGFGPAGNFGPEVIHDFTLTDPATINISLDINSNNTDLELYLLSYCEPNSCLAKSRNPVNESENIEIALQPGTYYIVVEGFRGDAGDYTLTIDNCNNDAVPMDNCEEIFGYNFENFQDGDVIPSDDNTGRWSYGTVYSDDPNDNSLDATIEFNGTDNGLVFNAGNYFRANTRLNLGNAYSGTYKIEWDMELQYVNGELYGGRVEFYEDNNIIENLYIDFGHTFSGNYASLGMIIPASPVGSIPLQLADITPIANYSGADPLKEFHMAIVYEPQKNKFTLYVDDVEIHTGIMNFDPPQLGTTRYIEFANDDDQDYMVIDNISYSECSKCSDNYNVDCNILTHQSLNVTQDDQVEVQLALNGMSMEDIDEYMVIDETTEDTIALDGLYYPNCIPGHTYKFCIVYLDEEGCPQICCFRLYIPHDCYYFTPIFTGDEDQIQYTYESNNVPSNYEIEKWYVDGGSAGSNSTIIESYDGPSHKSVCFLLYDPVLHTYILCCRRVCVSNPYNCELIQYQQNGDDYTFTLADDIDSASEVQWSLNDTPINDASGNTYQVNLTDYGGSVVRLCCYYRDISGCWKVCYREIEVMPAADAVIFKIDNVCGAPNEVIDVPIRVVNFDNITSLGFSVRISNTNVAELVGIQKANNWPDALSSSIFDVRRGVINWFDGGGNPYSAPDETIMANLQVRIVGNVGQSTAISITSDPVPITAENNSGSLTAQTVAGSICAEQNTATICGKITRPDGAAIKDVMVSLSGTSTDQYLTTSNGEYCFENLTLGTYTVTPTKDINYSNGVNPADLFYIRRHTLGIQAFTEGYDFMAADIDNSYSVTPADLFKLNRFTLALDSEFQDNNSWRFVPEVYQFPSSSNPLNPQYPESVTLNLNSNKNDIDFIGAKIGDVNNSNNPQNMRDEDILDGRNGINMYISETLLPMSETTTIPVRVTGFEGVIANGFSLKWDPALLSEVELIGANGYELNENNFNLNGTDEGQLGVVWYSTTGNPLTIPSDSTLFYISVKAIGDKGSSVSIDITEDPVPVSASTLDGNISTSWETNGISITHPTSAEDLAHTISKISIWPNPTSNKATLEISSTIAGEINISIQNSLGQEVKTITSKVNVGSNEILVDLEDSQFNSGLYLLHIKNGDSSSIIKLYKD